MSVTTFEHHVKHGRIEPDMMSGLWRFYSKEKLEVIKKQIRDEENYTLKQFSEMTGMGIKKIRYHFHKKRNIEPIGKCGKSRTYSIASLRMVAKSEGWELATTIDE